MTKLTVQVETLVNMGAAEIPETRESSLIEEVQPALKVIKRCKSQPQHGVGNMRLYGKQVFDFTPKYFAIGPSPVAQSMEGPRTPTGMVQMHHKDASQYICAVLK